MIGQSMVDAEINGGKMLSDIPEVEAGTRKMTDFFREFEVAGDEVGFFTRTKDFDNVEKNKEVEKNVEKWLHFPQDSLHLSRALPPVGTVEVKGPNA